MPVVNPKIRESNYKQDWTTLIDFQSLSDVASANNPPTFFQPLSSVDNSTSGQIEIYPDIKEVTNCPNSLLIAVWARKIGTTDSYLVGIIGYSAGENRSSVVPTNSRNAYSSIGTTFIDTKINLEEVEFAALILADVGAINVAYDFNVGDFIASNTGLSAQSNVRCLLTSNNTVPNGLGAFLGVTILSDVPTADSYDRGVYTIPPSTLFAGWDGIILNTSLILGNQEIIPQNGISGTITPSGVDLGKNEITVTGIGFDLRDKKYQQVRFRPCGSLSTLPAYLTNINTSTTINPNTTFYLLNCRKTGTSTYTFQLSVNGSSPVSLSTSGVGIFFMFPVGKFDVFRQGEELFSKNTFEAEFNIRQSLYYGAISLRNEINVSGAGTPATFTVNNTFGSTTPVPVRIIGTTMPTGLIYGETLYTVPGSTTTTTTQLSYTPGGRPVAAVAAAGSNVRLINLNDNSVSLVTAITAGANPSISALTTGGNSGAERQLFANTFSEVAIISSNTALPIARGFAIAATTTGVTISEKKQASSLQFSMPATGINNIVINNCNGIVPFHRKMVACRSDANDESKISFFDTNNQEITLENTGGNNNFILSPVNGVRVRGSIKIRPVSD